MGLWWHDKKLLVTFQADSRFSLDDQSQAGEQLETSLARKIYNENRKVARQKIQEWILVYQRMVQISLWYWAPLHSVELSNFT